MCVDVSVCSCVCMLSCLHVVVNICSCVCMLLCACAVVYVCMYGVCMYVCVYICAWNECPAGAVCKSKTPMSHGTPL